MNQLASIVKTACSITTACSPGAVIRLPVMSSLKSPVKRSELVMTRGTSYVEAWGEFITASKLWFTRVDALKESLKADLARGPRVLNVSSRFRMRSANQAFKFMKAKWQALDNSIN